jgi:hypothetical protein
MGDTRTHCAKNLTSFAHEHVDSLIHTAKKFHFDGNDEKTSATTSATTTTDDIDLDLMNIDTNNENVPSSTNIMMPNNPTLPINNSNHSKQLSESTAAEPITFRGIKRDHKATSTTKRTKTQSFRSNEPNTNKHKQHILFQLQHPQQTPKERRKVHSSAYQIDKQTKERNIDDDMDMFKDPVRIMHNSMKNNISSDDAEKATRAFVRSIVECIHKQHPELYKEDDTKRKQTIASLVKSCRSMLEMLVEEFANAELVS